MDPKEAYSLKVISEVKLEPQGLIHGETWIKENGYHTSIFLNHRPILEGKVSLPRFLGEDLYYVRSDGSAQLLSQSSYGEPKKVAELGKINKYEKHEKGLLILGEDLLDKQTPSAPFITEKRKYRFDGRGLLRTRTSLYLVRGEEVMKVLEGDFDVTDFATNGKRVVVSTTQPDDDLGLNALYDLDLDTGEVRRITKEDGMILAVAMNPHGDVAYLGHDKGKSPWAVREVILPELGERYVCGKTCGSTVLSDIFDGAKDKLVFLKDQLVSLGQVGGEVNVYRISDRKVDRLTEGQRVVRIFDYDGNSLAYSFMTPEKPSLLYHGEIYDPNPGVKGLTPVKINSSIEGWGIITGDRPTILFIHGGPHMAYGYGYFIEFQFFASNGFNVIYANPTGSQGYGEEFAKGCVGDWGGKDMMELLEFVNDARKQFNLTKKVGVTGGSYGGFMTNWIVTHSDLFSAAVSERGISNLVSMCGTSDIGFWFNAMESGVEDPWNPESMEKLMRMSPIYYVGRVKTPIMFIHGEEDYRCPIEQAEQFHVALRSRGVESKLVRYQGDGHEHARKGKPDNMMHRLRIKLQWFKDHLE
ncbi:Acylamino-acid-releasing enzyme [Metallosphaera sp. J1]|uniref:S9 family peptidase n=1 Tax=Metallosphaera javensis (ex Hofmann et al. 2022) TaxID=99938 RepID=UPI001EE10284|nr:S9 family peptidase [Metallosphaera javensis (ex Hofmann et al. 2022)]MCG3109667.1 Acylamino-acid-releasing enzyme [Metallosphaera javensis (ex Hofmann et al. 2022)]